MYRYREESISKKYDKHFDQKKFECLLLYDKLRDENYEKYCKFPSEEYYKDAGKFTLQAIFQYTLLPRIYHCNDKNKFSLFKRIAKSDLLKKAYNRFDINDIKSKSIDWWMLWMVKHRLYLAGHLICKYILYKK